VNAPDYTVLLRHRLMAAFREDSAFRDSWGLSVANAGKALDRLAANGWSEGELAHAAHELCRALMAVAPTTER
jgi:hypothetical protein